MLMILSSFAVEKLACANYIVCAEFVFGETFESHQPANNLDPAVSDSAFFFALRGNRTPVQSKGERLC